MRIILVVLFLLLAPVEAFAGDWTIGLLSGVDVDTRSLAPGDGALFEVDALKNLNSVLAFGIETQYSDTIAPAGLPQSMLSVFPSLRITPMPSLFVDLGVGPSRTFIPSDLIPRGSGNTPSFSIAEKVDLGLAHPITDKLSLVWELGIVFDSVELPTSNASQNNGLLISHNGVSQNSGIGLSMDYGFTMIGINF